MAAIHNIPSERRGSANSTVSFVRQFGMTVGITVYGIIQRNVLLDNFNGSGQMVNGGAISSDPRALLSEQARASMPETVLNKAIDILANSIGYTFSWGLVPGV